MVVTKPQAVIIVLLLTIIILLLLPTDPQVRKDLLKKKFPAVHEYFSTKCDASSSLNKVVPSFQGNVTYSELLEKVYKSYGFELNYDIICKPKPDVITPFISLKPLNECSTVFENWIKVNDVPIKNEIVWDPPKELRREYDLRNYTRLSPYPLNDAHNKDEKAVLDWNMSVIEKERKAVRDNHGGYPYGVNRGCVFNAYKSYPPKGSGLVVGSIEPWVEGFALELGADKITTQEYQIIKTEESRITWKHPMDIAKNWESFQGFDFVTSFSSIEHSGLGRYGDALDPIGDFREAQKIHCLLKPGGLFYLGLPSANGPWHEETAFNAHRVYGWVRWPAMAAGFEVINIFDGDISAKPLDQSKIFPKSYQDILLLLRKPL